jgi:hypothetical protein
MGQQVPGDGGRQHTPGNTAGHRKGLDDAHSSGRSPERAPDGGESAVNTDEQPTADAMAPQEDERKRAIAERDVLDNQPESSSLDPEFEQANRQGLEELEKDGVVRPRDDDQQDV